MVASLFFEDLAWPTKRRCRTLYFLVATAFLASCSAQVPLAPGYAAELRELVAGERLSDLQWPNFRAYRIQVATFYESSSYALAWIRDGALTSQAEAMIQSLRDAATKGLAPEDYDGSRWPQRLLKLRSGADEADYLRFDLALTVSAMRYISDLDVGRVNPSLLHSGLCVERSRCDLPALLRQLVQAQDIRSVLEQIEPPFEGYRRTLQALQRYLILAREDGGELLSEPQNPVEPGTSYSGVPRLARLLRRVGDLSPDMCVNPDSEVYERPLVDAVKRFQIRHGLEPNGRIGRSTLRQLNMPLKQRVRQLQFTLERWRWVPHRFSRPPIVVNIPEFRLRALNESYRSELEMKVVVGKAYRHRTPLFTSELKYVIFRPYWNVPLSIQRAELAPQLDLDRSYLIKHGYEVVTPGGQIVTDGTVSDGTLTQLRSGKVIVRQRPGPMNALGRVKFVFPNENGVYMHDTPTQQLFSRSRRDFSHGCIRVEKAEELARWVLRQDVDWSPDRIAKAMNGTRPIQVNLSKSIPVLIVYGTAVVLEGEEVRFFDDVYGYEERLEAELAKGHP